jgi:hypothetical protein
MLGTDVRATQFTDWLAADYELGLGHARALWKYFKDQGWVGGAQDDQTKKARKK